MAYLRRKPPRRKPKPTQVQRDGGLALTFVNTELGRLRPLESYAELLEWTRRHNALSTTLIDALEDFAEGHPEDAEAAFEEATELLAVLSRIFNAITDRQKPPKDAVQALNAYFTGPLPRLHLQRTADHFRWVWEAPGATDLWRPLWYVVRSAGEILTSAKDCKRLTRCDAENCGALFVANNSGKPRKWCDRKSCGSRDKARRHYQEKVRPRREEYKENERSAKQDYQTSLALQKILEKQRQKQSQDEEP